jgi:hypothetical protein
MNSISHAGDVESQMPDHDAARSPLNTHPAQVAILATYVEERPFFLL